MAWVKILSSVPRHPKFQKAGPEACWLWLCGLCYCQDGLTDGFIPVESIDFLGVKGASRHAGRLVTVGLWETVSGGWQVHDYFDHNKTAAEVRHLTETRREAGEAGGKASGEARRQQLASSNGEANEQANAKQATNPDLLCTASAPHTAVRKERTAAQPPLSPKNGNSQTKTRLATEPNGDNFHVIAALVRDAISEGIPESDLVDTIKCRASIHQIDYGRLTGEHDVITRAVASEWFKYQHPELTR